MKINLFFLGFILEYGRTAQGRGLASALAAAFKKCLILFERYMQLIPVLERK